ncbi:MAG: hypothetical protein AAGB93_01200 [Planctomycetota bacterium]
MLRNRSLFAAALAALVAFGLRLPFALAPGFGLDFDAWRLASTARGLAEEGVWRPSRAPGYPGVELAFALLWPLGPRALTVATAGVAALAAAFGAAWLARARPDLRAPWLLPAALTTLPAVAIPAASALDMPWSLAAVTAAGWRCQRRDAVGAGLAVGLAVWMRPASAVAVPALFVHLARAGSWRRAVVGSGAAVAVAALITLAPDPPPIGLADSWPGPVIAWRVLVLNALASGGVAAILALLVGAWLGRRRPKPGPDADAAFFALTFLGGAALYVLFPYEANYLCVPLFVGGLALGARAVAATHWVAATALVVGGLASFDGSELRAGPLRRDAWRRAEQEARARATARSLEGTPESTWPDLGSDLAAVRYFVR